MNKQIAVSLSISVLFAGALLCSSPAQAKGHGGGAHAHAGGHAGGHTGMGPGAIGQSGGMNRQGLGRAGMRNENGPSASGMGANGIGGVGVGNSGAVEGMGNRRMRAGVGRSAWLEGAHRDSRNGQGQASQHAAGVWNGGNSSQSTSAATTHNYNNGRTSRQVIGTDGGVWKNGIKEHNQQRIHAEKNQDIAVENDETHLTVPILEGNDKMSLRSSRNLKAGRTETVDNNETITIHNDRSSKIGTYHCTVGPDIHDNSSAYKLTDIMVSSFRQPNPGGNLSLTKTGTGTLGLTKVGAGTMGLTKVGAGTQEMGLLEEEGIFYYSKAPSNNEPISASPLIENDSILKTFEH